MKNWLANLFGARQEKRAAPEEPAAPAQPDLLDLQKEVQSLRIELASREQTIEHLKLEIERLRGRQGHLVDQTVASRLESLFSDLAAPASQILTQADLLENQDRDVQARDVLSVAKRMVRALERNGMVFEGRVGEQVAFDANLHTPIHSDAAPQNGEPVTVRFSGVSFQGKLLYKAMVDGTGL